MPTINRVGLARGHEAWTFVGMRCRTVRGIDCEADIIRCVCCTRSMWYRGRRWCSVIVACVRQHRNERVRREVVAYERVEGASAVRSKTTTINHVRVGVRLLVTQITVEEDDASQRAT